jgi:membrane-associated phospholipid phosphatase
LAAGGILALAAVFFALRVPSNDAARKWAALHAGLLALFVLGRLGWRIWEDRPWRDGAWIGLKFALLMTLYMTLGVGGLAVFDWGADALFSEVDRWLLFGHRPVLVVAGLATSFVTEALSLVYGWYIPFLYLSVLSGCIGRPRHERERFFDGLALLYAVSYLGYLFFPARGPIAFMAAQFPAPLPDGPLHDQVLRSIAATGGPMGAFPSLHVGVSVYNCLFDLRFNRLRGLTYIVPVALIALATLVLRYHYLVDVLVGFGLAVLTTRVAWGRTR